MKPLLDLTSRLNRRHFLGRGAHAVGLGALASLLGREARRRQAGPALRRLAGRAALRAEGEAGHLSLSIGWTVANGAVRPQADVEEIPRDGAARLGPPGTAADGYDLRSEELSRLASAFRFAQHGKSGAWLSELLPHTAKIADELCIIRSMHTEAINHDPGHHLHPDRLAATRPAFDRRRGSATAWAEKPTTCRRSWS